MSWTTTFSTGQIVTATELNTLSPTMAQNTTNKVAFTGYQNTTGKPLFVNIGATASATNVALYAAIWVNSTSPATGNDAVAIMNLPAIAGDYSRITLSCVVPQDFYYTFQPSPTTPTMNCWTEVTMF